MVMGQPAWKTMWAASGSLRMLASATGEALPGTVAAPPMRTTSLTFSAMRGSVATARAIGQRPQRDERDLAGVLHDGFDDEGRGAAFIGL